MFDSHNKSTLSDKFKSFYRSHKPLFWCILAVIILAIVIIIIVVIVVVVRKNKDNTLLNLQNRKQLIKEQFGTDDKINVDTEMEYISSYINSCLSNNTAKTITVPSIDTGTGSETEVKSETTTNTTETKPKTGTTNTTRTTTNSEQKESYRKRSYNPFKNKSK